MLNHYYKTTLETKIETLYQNYRIISPGEINIELIAHLFHVYIISLPEAKEEAIWDEKNAAIFLNSNKPYTEIRETFFHELCHILLHCGNQLTMNHGLLGLQEEQAQHFLLYAAIPFFMIHPSNLPANQHDIIHFLATEFNVTHTLAEKRWDQIQRRIFSTKLQHVYEAELQCRYRKSDPSNWSNETKYLHELAIRRKQQKEHQRKVK